MLNKAHSEKEKIKKEAKSMLSQTHDGMMEKVKMQSRILKNKRETMISIHVMKLLSRIKSKLT